MFKQAINTDQKKREKVILEQIPIKKFYLAYLVGSVKMDSVDVFLIPSNPCVILIARKGGCFFAIFLQTSA